MDKNFESNFGSWRKRTRDFYEISKPGIVRMVLVTAAFGFLMGQGNGWVLFGATLLGIGMATAGAAALNNVLEKDADSRMERTRSRAIPAGRVEPSEALTYGVWMVLMGVALLALYVNLLCAFLVLLSAFLYVLVYTPMKTRTWLNTSVGAIPGALPVACGWVAATGRMDAGAWMAFAILYAWQHPHFFAISWLYREEYRAAGFKMLSVVDPTGKLLFVQVLFFSMLLLLASVLPGTAGVMGWVYLVAALALGLWMLISGLVFIQERSNVTARKLLKTSLLYLPLLFLSAALDIGLNYF